MTKLPKNVATFIRRYVENTQDESMSTSIDVPIFNTVEQRQMFFGMYTEMNGVFSVQFEVGFHCNIYVISSTDEEGAVHDFEM